LLHFTLWEFCGIIKDFLILPRFLLNCLNILIPGFLSVIWFLLGQLKGGLECYLRNIQLLHSMQASTSLLARYPLCSCNFVVMMVPVDFLNFDKLSYALHINFGYLNEKCFFFSIILSYLLFTLLYWALSFQSPCI